MAPPGLRGSSFRLGEGPLALRGAGAPAAQGPHGDTAGTSASSIEFCTSAGDGRCWEFLLAQPSPSHLAALCVECRAGGGGAPMRLASFDAGRLLEEGGAGRAPLDLEVLARGRG
jgi:hypothetical protein